MNSRIPDLIFPVSGLVLAIGLWWLGTSVLIQRLPAAINFAPLPTLEALAWLLQDPHFYDHILVSLKRVAVGLLCALAIGIPLGLLTGLSRRFAMASGPVFQFLRMISPLSWMPIAVMVLGVGDAPVYFLLSFAAVWPIILNTASGVAQLDKNWLLLSQSLSATRTEFILRLVLPGITAHLLAGCRLSIGIIWVILVPAEMLGVDAGLGYFILDARDRLAYDELMAAIVVIGATGFTLDTLARQLHRYWTEQR